MLGLYVGLVGAQEDSLTRSLINNSPHAATETWPYLNMVEACGVNSSSCCLEWMESSQSVR